MNRYFFALVFVLGLAICATSCKMNVLRGEGNKTTTNLPVSPFNAISIDVDVNTVINVKEGATPGVQIDGYENLLKHIVATVDKGRLRITHDLDDTWRMESEDVTVTITVPSISKLTLMGSADAVIHGSITGNAFMLDVSGACDVSIDNVSADSLLVEASGATDLEIKDGTVKYAEYDINGAGEVKAFPLQTNETIAEISGAGTSHVTALQKLTVDISGAGTIKYKGHPVITKDISGAGTIADAN